MTPSLREKLKDIDIVEDDNGEFKYEGSIDRFVDIWEGPVMINKIHGYIAITQYKSFSMR